MIYILIVLPFVAVIFVYFHKWKNLRAENLFKTTLPNTPTSTNEPQMTAHCIVLCNKAIVAGIECILSSSAMEACRNNRVFGSLFSGYKSYRNRQTNSPRNEYLDSLWDAGLKNTEITRRIATSPYISLIESEKIDMAEIRDDIKSLTDAMSNPSTDDADLKADIAKVKASVCGRMRRYSRSVRGKNCNERSAGSLYLSFMHNLYTYIISMQKIA